MTSSDRACDARDNPPAPFSGDSGMCARVHAHDWSQTPLGPMERWPRSLRTAVDICLDAGFPHYVWWGPDLIQIYNDEATKILRAKHPAALGQPARECWADVWAVVGPLADSVVATGVAERRAGFELLPDRGGPREPAYFDFCFSALRDESGDVAGLFITAIETTERMRAEAARDEVDRRLAQAIDIARLGHWQLDLATQTLTVSAQCKRNFGREPEDPFGYEELRAAIHPDDRERQAAAVAAAIESQSEFHVEYRLLTPAGELRWADIRGRFGANGGKSPRLVGVSLDITRRKRAESAMRESEERQAFLLKLSDTLRPLKNPVAIQAEASRVLGEHLGVNRALYTEIEADDEHNIVERDYTVGVPGFAGRYRPDDFGADLMREARAGRTFLVADVATDARLSDAERAAYVGIDIAAHVAVPLVKDGRLAALFFVMQVSPRAWTAGEVLLVEETAERTWAAVERARAEEAVAEDLRDMQILQALAEQTISDGDAQAVYDKILDAAIALTRADAGTIQLYDEQTQTLAFLSAKNIPSEMTEKFARVNAGSQTSCGIALLTGERAFIDFDSDDTENEDGSLKIHVEHGFLSGQSTPLISRSGKPIGMFSTHWRKHHRPSEREFRFLDLLARQASDLIEQRQAEEALRGSEEKYRTLFESIDEGFCVIEIIEDHDGRPSNYRFLEVNEKFERRTGIADVAGKLGSEVSPGTEAYWLETYGQIARTGGAKRFESHHEDSGRWYDVFATRVGGPESRQVSIVFQDTTERREREERQAFLLKLSDRLRSLADPIEIMAAASETLGRHLDVGRCGYGETDSTGAFLAVERDWTDGCMPSAVGKHRFADFGEEIMATLLAGHNKVIDDTLPRATKQGVAEAYHAAGELRASIGIPLMKNGRMVAALFVQQSSSRRWIANDVALAEETAERTWAALERARAEAALRDSEEKYRTLFQTMGQGYCDLELLRDSQGRAIDQLYVELNPAYERLIGIPVADAKGRTASEVMPDLEPRWTEAFDRIAKRGEPERIEYEVASLGRWFEVFVYPRGGDRLTVLYGDVTDRKRAEEVLRQSEKRQAFLLKLSDALRAEPDADAVANRAIRMLSEQMRLDRCYIGKYRLADDRVDIPYQVGNDQVPPMPDELRASDFPEAFAQVFDRTLVIDDIAKTEGLSDADRRNISAFGLQAVLAPVVRKGENKPLWMIVAVSGRPRRWTRGEIALAEEATERTWAAVERAKAEQALRESGRRLAAELSGAQLLQRLSTRLIPEQPPEVLHGQILDAAIELMQADAVSIQLLDDGGERLRRLATRNLHPESTEYWTWVDASHASTCGQALRTNRRVIVEDVEASAEMAGTGDLEAFRRSGTRAVQSTPLVSRSGRPIGMISTHWHEPRKLAESDFGLFDVLARQIADLLERSQAETALRENEAKYRSLFESVDDGFCIIELIDDADGHVVDYRLVEVNDAFERQTGLKDVAGKGRSEVAPPGEPHWLQLCGEVARSGESKRFENHHQATERWYSGHVTRCGGAGSRQVAILFEASPNAKSVSGGRCSCFSSAMHCGR